MAQKRSEVESKYKWRPDHIIETDAVWEDEISKIKAEIPSVVAYKGKLSDRQVLLEFLRLTDSLTHRIERLYVYAMMRRDENVALPAYQSLCERAESVYVEFNSLSSFVAPELAACKETFLLETAALPEFSDYDYFLKEIIRSKKHLLSAKEEKLLAEAGEALGAFGDIFTVLNNVDIKFGDVEVDGEKTELTHGTYSLLLQNSDRSVRKTAYTNIYKSFKALINTVATTYAGNVKAGAFFAKARGYQSCLTRALDADNIPDAVYKNLLKAVGGGLGVLHQYVDYRKKTLELPTMYMYDMYVPLVEGAELKLSYEDAFKTVKQSLAPLGEEYAQLLDKSFSEGWIDVFETENKRSGAYSVSAKGTHPYVLLNYHKTTHDVFTIAHELGHAMHSYMSDKAQPYAKAGYKIFVAEVASTVNEVLLLKHLINSANKKLKKYLLSYYLDMFRTTFFRQAMFAEFEHNAHKMYEEGTPLNQDNLSAMYLELNRKYYGKSVEHDDDLIKYEWARIPHFYSAFYVYKYATGLTSAVNIASSILKDGAPAVERYMRFLSAGGNGSPYDILREAGVDLATDTPFLIAMQEFGDTLEQLLNS